MNRSQLLAVSLLMLIPVSIGWAYPWDKDMVDQPSQKAQRSIAPPGPGSVPTDGGEIVARPLNDDEASELKDAAATLENPVPANAESIARGKVFYEVNCLVCHGAGGRGDGAVGKKFISKAPVDLNDPYTQDQADGQLFFTLTRGRGKMPFYRDALSPSERWDVVNYLKHTFGEPSMAHNE